MNSKLLNRILIGLIVLLFFGSIASAYLGQNMLEEKSDELLAAKATNQALRQQEISLTQAKEEIAEYSALATVARSIVAQEKDQARTVREIVKIAGQSGINLSSIAFPSSDLGLEDAAQTSQLTPVENIPGILELEITLASEQVLQFDQITDFLTRLENNRRTSIISSVNITPTNDPDTNVYGLRLNLILKVYVQR